MNNRFQQRKQEVLNKKDKSSIGFWDEKISKLCEKINSFEEYYTTSSCSGRIIVMIDSDKKCPGLFKFVSHDLISFDELWGKISSLSLEIDCSESEQVQDSSLGKIVKKKNLTNEDLVINSECLRKNLTKSILEQGQDLKFKQEPPILHIACKDLESAEKLLNLGRKAGWKKSGILSLGKNIIVELNCSWKLEFPLVKEGKLLVGEEFLKEVLRKANRNLEKGWGKIEKLGEEL